MSRYLRRIGFTLGHDKDAISFANIVALCSKSLASDEYNAPLDDFLSRILKPAADELGLKCYLSGDEDRFPEPTSCNRARSAIFRPVASSGIQSLLALALKVWRPSEIGLRGKFCAS